MFQIYTDFIFSLAERLPAYTWKYRENIGCVEAVERWVTESCHCSQNNKKSEEWNVNTKLNNTNYKCASRQEKYVLTVITELE